MTDTPFIDQLTGEEVLTCAINIGEQLLMSGAEISRVEDTIRRICAAYDIKAKPYIFHRILHHRDIRNKSHKWITQTRRILSYGTDMWKLDRLNNLSRLICSTKPPLERINREYALILNGPVYPSCGTMPYLRNDSRCICDLLWRKSIGRFFCHVCGGH